MRILLLLAVILVAVSSARAEENALRVMTFNIRYDTKSDGENAWPHRKDWVAEIIREQRPDVIGLQEVLGHQLKDLEQRLSEYASHGAGRDDGKEAGEHVPLLYKKERFEVLDRGHFWLSETPEAPGSKSWDTSITRMTSWLKLKDKATAKTLLVANTHFDHKGKQARTESAKLLLERLAKLAGDAPVVLTGDFNTLPDSEPYAILTGKGAASTWILTDTRRASKQEPEGPNSTWNAFRRVMPEQQIDFIFTRGLTTQSHAILVTERDGKFASDHLPVMTELR